MPNTKGNLLVNINQENNKISWFLNHNMQHLLNQLSDEQLLDIFVLIEDDHEQLAVEYFMRHARFSRVDALAALHYLLKQRDEALGRYASDSSVFLPLRKLERESSVIEAEDDFPDEFIFNLDFSHTSSQPYQQLKNPQQGAQLYTWLITVMLLLVALGALLYDLSHAST